MLTRNAAPFLGLVLLLILVMTGCSHRKHNTSKPVFTELSVDEIRATSKSDKTEVQTDNDAWSGKQTAAALIAECQARLVDIPVPLETHPIACSYTLSRTQFLFEYVSTLSARALLTSYRAEFERCGWQEKACFMTDNVVLVFEKPQRMCVITYKSAGSKGQRITLLVQG
jgi:hypothetical protein